MIYELVAGALASYLLGDSVTQFSTIIGTYLFSMGIGSFLSKFCKKNLLGTFIQVELLIGFIGGFSAASLFLLFDWVIHFRVVLYFLVGIIGTLVGLEIPLLMRILKDRFEFSELISQVFTFDYIGALFAALIFPLLLVPHLGLIRTALLFGMLNVSVGLWALYLLKEEVPWARFHKGTAFMVLIVLAIGFAYSDSFTSFAESAAYPDDVIYSKSSHYQRIVLTHANNDLRLFLNGNLQFSSKDEYRYHEALVHPALATVENPKHILVLGGGDGLAVREILKYSTIESITLVDLDPIVTELFSKQPYLKELNQSALLSAKVKVVNQDAFSWIKTDGSKYDFIAVDFPDPSNFSVGKLYTDTFYRLLSLRLAPEGRVVVQSTSPFVARRSFWCVDKTLRSVGFTTAPYHVNVPSFGEWGFIIASKNRFSFPTHLPLGLRFLEPSLLAAFFQFPKDMIADDVPIQKLNSQALVRLFEEEWAYYAR